MNVAFSPQAGHVLLSRGSRKSVPSPPVGRNALRIAAQSVARPAGAGRSRVRVPPIRRMPHSGTHSVSEWESRQRSIAQWRERPPPKRKAAGSNPVGTTQGTRRVQTIRVCAMDSWTVAMACDDTTDEVDGVGVAGCPSHHSSPCAWTPIGCAVWAGIRFRSSTWQSARNGRADAGSKPAETTARQRHPCQSGSPSSRLAWERWRRGVLLYHSHRPASAHPLSTRRTSTSPMPDVF